MVARVVWDHEAAGSSPVTSTIGMRRRFIEICGASVIRYTCRNVLRLSLPKGAASVHFSVVFSLQKGYNNLKFCIV